MSAGSRTADRVGVDVLFAGHDATRTGAPLMFLYFLRWLREHTELRFELVLVAGGPLVEDFAAVCPVTVLEDLDGGPVARALARGRLGAPARWWRDRARRAALAHVRRAPVLYCNSSSSIEVVRLLDERPDRVVITHVHEMEAGFRSMGPGVVDLLLATTDRFVSASDRVTRVLVEHLGVDPDRVTRHYEFIDVPAMVTEPPSPEDVGAARASAGIPEGAAVVGAVGVTQWRKGPDLFLLLAQLVGARAEGREVHFVWLGADPDAAETRSLQTDIERTGLADRVHLVPPERGPARWFALFDVFVLTSREDPFPLVCLESSLLGTPIVCFDNTGMAEFAGDGDCGYMVDYLDVEAMADRVLTLLSDDALRRAVGERAARRVREEFDVSAGAPALHRDLRTWMGDR
ncbi:MAG TPA: glycosyltransferase family 4 protein [Acidimicrobiales bacterium]|nr:glycosyltransferase family 4 protein [Acidimicrobiales bacterium]